MRAVLLLLIVSMLYSCNRNEKAEYDKALELSSVPLAKQFTKGCISTPCIADGHYLTAYLYNEKDQLDSAIGYALRSIQMFEEQQRPKKAIDAYWLAGDILGESGNYEGAVTYYQKALANQPIGLTEMKIKLNMANSLWVNGNWSEAEGILRNTIDYFQHRDDYKCAESHLLMGNVLTNYQDSIADGDYQESLYHYFTALECFNSPKLKAIVLNNIGKVYMSIDDLDIAETFFDSAHCMQTDQDQITDIVYNIGLLHSKKNDLQTAMEYYNELIGTDRDLTAEVRNTYIESVKKLYRQGDKKGGQKLMEEYDSRILNHMEETEYMRSKLQEEQLLKMPLTKDQLNVARENEPVTLETLGMIGAIAILIIGLGIWLWMRYEKKKKAEDVSSVKNLVDMLNSVSE